MDNGRSNSIGVVSNPRRGFKSVTRETLLLQVTSGHLSGKDALSKVLERLNLQIDDS
jgi:hypothetical protein